MGPTLHLVQARNSAQMLAIAVRRRRLAMALSQEAFAARAKLHRTYIGAIERAEENVTLATLDKLAKALSVAPNELLKG